MTTRIYKDPSGWTAFRIPGGTWDIFTPDQVRYATWTISGGLLFPFRPGKTVGIGKALGRVDGINDAVIVARAAWRLTH